MTWLPTNFRVSDVFVPGGLPTVTYVPRAALRLEERVREYLEERHRILSVSGPTKSGKTVLLRSILRDQRVTWIPGGQVRSAEDFWEILVDELGLPTGDAVTTSSGQSAGSDVTLSGGLNLGLIKTGGEAGGTSTQTSGQSYVHSRTRPTAAVARRALLEDPHPLVVDDFHYVPQDVQEGIVRALKEPVFEGLPVIFVSVPHRAYDVIRVEKEMTGRLEQLPIEFWSEEDLAGIARIGFEVLKVTNGEEIAKGLTPEAFSSPHLMQDFCLQVCKLDGLRDTASEPRPLELPDWGDFFQTRTSDASRTAFERLARGPRQRSDRIVRRLKDGTETDIYGAVLAAIAATGPLTELREEALRASLRQVIDGDPPRGPEVTRVLEEINKIAHTEIAGEPVVDWDAEMRTLYISDPFFAFYLRWAARPTAKPAK